MLNLLAISYWNIGPFKNKTLTLFFEEWNYLIKAPIWTWKSFLFFDGPCFALYKTSSRNILNIQSKTWFVKLLFEVDWQTYFVTRFLKQWKSKDSTESFLYSTPIDWKEILWKIPHDDILVEGIDIENNLKSWEYQLEAISFKNEKRFTTIIKRNSSSTRSIFEYNFPFTRCTECFWNATSGKVGGS